ncbi:hypothetical protein [Croceicoccus ponticola]|uniref:hypothetical protein n=1 Tax=Croceicoccus ponticola TaxID=2217664 RepID=UPI0013E30A8C|nr:hypothetical protein [Croceicoccus ponticola]
MEFEICDHDTLPWRDEHAPAVRQLERKIAARQQADEVYADPYEGLREPIVQLTQ